MGLQLPQQAPRSPGRAARKEARKGALKVPKDSLIPGSPARAPPGRPITIPFASATTPREDARRVLSATSPMCARYASGRTRDISAPWRPARLPIRKVQMPDLGRPRCVRELRHRLHRWQLRGPCECCTFSLVLRDGGTCKAA